MSLPLLDLLQNCITKTSIQNNYVRWKKLLMKSISIMENQLPKDYANARLYRQYKRINNTKRWSNSERWAEKIGQPKLAIKDSEIHRYSEVQASTKMLHKLFAECVRPPVAGYSKTFDFNIFPNRKREGGKRSGLPHTRCRMVDAPSIRPLRYSSDLHKGPAILIHLPSRPLPLTQQTTPHLNPNLHPALNSPRKFFREPHGNIKLGFLQHKYTEHD